MDPATSRWLFDGVGGVALVSLAIFLLERFSKDKTVGNSRPENTTIKNETSGNQNLGVGFGNIKGSTINIAAPIHAANHVAPGQPRSLPKMKCTGSDVIRVGPNFTWLVENQDGRDAFVLRFTNEAGLAPNVGGEVRAKIIYQDSDDVEVTSIIGYWLNEASDSTRFKVDDSKWLVVGIYHNEEFAAAEWSGSRVELRAVRPFEIVKVRLTDANHGDILYTGRFDVSLHMLKITPLSSERIG